MLITHPPPPLHMYPQNCDLTGCELQHANLRGSNLTGAILKEIVAPLHMSQTVNVTTVSSQPDGTPQQPPPSLAAGHGHAPFPHHAVPPAQVQLPQQPHHQHNRPGASPPHLQLPVPGGVGDGGAVGGIGNGNGISDLHTGSTQEQGSQEDSNT